MDSQTISFLERVKIDAAILGSSGFGRNSGPTSNTFEDCQIKKAAIQNVQTSIVEWPDNLDILKRDLRVARKRK